MATLFRTGLCRVFSANGKTLIAKNNGVLALRCISSKYVRSVETDRPKKPPPFDFRKDKYRRLTRLWDKTTDRFDENTKVLVVEGPIAAGKTQFAKELAEELDMLYFPEANLDMVYINAYGYDLRQLDEQLPEPARSFDVPDFLVNPKHQNAAAFQLNQYNVRFSQYIDALAHLFNSGQGVVLDRCCYSDFVFVEAMFNKGYMSKEARHIYYETRKNSLYTLLRPHLVIYLDLPVSKVKENIAKRGYTCEKNSPVLTDDYLTTIEKTYKQQYLKQIGNHAELLIYDWSDGGEVEAVVEDIENIDFDPTDETLIKAKDWLFELEEDYAIARTKYSHWKYRLESLADLPWHTAPELMMNGEEAIIRDRVFDNAPGEKYQFGYNADMGDQGVLFKQRNPIQTLPMRERVLK